MKIQGQPFTQMFGLDKVKNFFSPKEKKDQKIAAAAAASISTENSATIHPLKKEGIQLEGGHAENFKQMDDGFIQKSTTQSECQLYKDINDENNKDYESLKKITPEIRKIVVEGDLASVEMKNLTEGYKDKPAVMDIKLGKKTYSRSVDQVRGKGSTTKKAMMKIVDAVTSRSFKVIKGKSASERLQAAKSTENIFSEVLCEALKNDAVRSDVLKQLNIIDNALYDAPVAFFGHSLLFVVGKDSQGNDKVDVKLIDIGNHLREDEINGDPRLKKSYSELRENTTQAIDDIRTLVKRGG